MTAPWADPWRLTQGILLLIIVLLLASRQLYQWRAERWARRRLRSGLMPQESLPPFTSRHSPATVYVQAMPDGSAVLLGYLAAPPNGSPHPLLYGAPLSVLAFGKVKLTPGLVLAVDSPRMRDWALPMRAGLDLERQTRDGRPLVGGPAELAKLAAAMRPAQPEQADA